MVEWKVTVKGDFFSRKQTITDKLQSDVVFDFESNGGNFNSLALPGGEKKIIFNFFTKWRHE